MRIVEAKLQSKNKILLVFDHAPDAIQVQRLTFSPHITVLEYEAFENSITLITEDLDIKKNYSVFVRGIGILPILPDGIFKEYVSKKSLGFNIEFGRFAFRLFAPRALRIQIILYSNVKDEIGTSYDMAKDDDGVWEIGIDSDIKERYYCYRVTGPIGSGEMFDSSVPVADPYGRLVVTQNTFRHKAKTVIPVTIPEFDWEDDKSPMIDPRDLIIYETHIRDTTIHPSSGVSKKIAGTYLGLVEKGKTGGISYLKSLGINAVEILPSQHFASIEPPYKQYVNGIHNTWNPYERNHWGYMTSYFFAPEPYYATGGSLKSGEWNDTGGRPITEFKEMVKAFHQEGIAVIMDVVYNHTSQYDFQPLKYIDKKYYYHTDNHGNFTNMSGCGNDLNSSRPMVRRLIIDSVLYWMREFHVDGFRFDLAAIIDQETFIELCAAAREVNPNVILIAEPWGGNQYDLRRYSEIGMSAWNDIFRNGVKGQNPYNALGYIFGAWGWNSPEAFGKWILGSIENKGGPFFDASHSVNYLACHDGYTLGDFIRIATGDVFENADIKNIEESVVLTARQKCINRLAAFMLFISQGALMMEAGQEFARAKIIPDREIPGIIPLRIDHNSYEKDDETNWINYKHAELNNDLVDYYRGLIEVRKTLSPLRRERPDEYQFLVPNVPVASGFIIDQKESEGNLIAVLVNANHDHPAEYELPAGKWDVWVDGDQAGLQTLKRIIGRRVTVPSSSGMLLVRKSLQKHKPVKRQKRKRK